VRRRLKDHASVEDVVQETFIGFSNSLVNFDDKRDLQTWLFTIANHLALNEVRAVRRRRRVFRDAPPVLAREDDSAERFWANVPDRSLEAPPESVERKEMESLIEGLLDRLPGNQRAAVELQRDGDLSYREIAEVIGVSMPAVKSLLVRARESLKRGLEQYLEGKVRGKPA
jgi:RNA polymerase sigma-70 factor (ECF subfamily)